VKREDLSKILERGTNPEKILVYGETNYWFRGDDLKMSKRPKCRLDKIPARFSPFIFLINMGLEENHVINELTTPYLGQYIVAALYEVNQIPGFLSN
jgi:hypothetical protein